jgi:hypothetical protein
MQPWGSLPYSQQPSTGTYPESNESSPQLLPYFHKIHFNIILPSTYEHM